jgi:hypothetical protein
MFDPKQHYENSSLREIIVEHQFVGAALKCLWSAGIVDAEILRSEFDGFGYDLVLTKGDVVRHIQLKSGLDLKPVGISRLLSEKPSGCVVFIQISNGLDMGPFFWFGSSAKCQLPEISSLSATKRTTPNSQGEKPKRTKHHDVPANRFTRFETMEELLETLLDQPLQISQ